MTRNNGARNRVLEYLQKREGQPVWLADMARELDLEPRVAQSAIANAIRDNAAGAQGNLEIVLRGQQWRWRSNRSRGKRMFEELAVTKNGDVLVECEDGTVYRLVEL